MESEERKWQRSQEFRKLCRDVTRGVADYGMIGAGDRVLVGISGGEDSLTLMHALTELRRRSPFPFTLVGGTVDMQFGPFRLDVLKEYASRWGWEFEVVSLEGQRLLQEHHAEERPCALCSRLRRGQLHGLADRLGCNKIALGQQLDDLCVSLLMSLFHGGGLKTMGANVAADGGSKRLIRPLCYVTKERVHRVAELAGYPSIKSCPYEQRLKEDGDRYYLERLLEQLGERFEHVRSAMLRSMSDVRLGHLLDLRYRPEDGEADPDGGKL